MSARGTTRAEAAALAGTWRCEAYVERRRPGHRCYRRGTDYLFNGDFVTLCRQHRARRFAVEALARAGVFPPLPKEGAR